MAPHRVRPSHMGALAEIPPGPLLGGVAVYNGEVHLGFVIARARGFDAVALRGDLGCFDTAAAAARCLIALTAPQRREDE